MKKDAKKMLQFKDEKYSVYDLLLFFTDSRLKDFKEGDVINLTDGTVFDIKNIKENLTLMNKEVIDNAEHLSYNEKHKLRRMLSKDENDKIKAELNSKLNSEIITMEELKELMEIEGDDFDDSGVNVSLINTDFVKLNQGNLFNPKIRDVTLGKFLKLLMLVTYENTVKRTNRDNSKNITKTELKKYLGIANDKTFSNIFQEMETYDLLFRKQKTGKGFVIFINPLYANRGSKFNLDKTQYVLFKDNLKEKLPKRLSYYMDKIVEENNCYFEIDED